MSQNHTVKLLRVEQTERSTLGHLYIDGVFACYTLEDALRKEKMPGKTAIPVGNYLLKLNTGGGMNQQYERKFEEIHEGMLEIIGIPNFRYVYLHVGNHHEHTAGCPLLGMSYGRDKHFHFQVTSSSLAYAKVYPVLVEMVMSKPAVLQVENQQHLKLYK